MPLPLLRISMTITPVCTTTNSLCLFVYLLLHFLTTGELQKRKTRKPHSLSALITTRTHYYPSMYTRASCTTETLPKRPNSTQHVVPSQTVPSQKKTRGWLVVSQSVRHNKECCHAFEDEASYTHPFHNFPKRDPTHIVGMFHLVPPFYFPLEKSVK